MRQCTHRVELQVLAAAAAARRGAAAAGAACPLLRAEQRVRQHPAAAACPDQRRLSARSCTTTAMYGACMDVQGRLETALLG